VGGRLCWGPWQPPPSPACPSTWVGHVEPIHFGFRWGGKRIVRSEVLVLLLRSLYTNLYRRIHSAGFLQFAVSTAGWITGLASKSCYRGYPQFCWPYNPADSAIDGWRSSWQTLPGYLSGLWFRVDRYIGSNGDQHTLCSQMTTITDVDPMRNAFWRVLRWSFRNCLQKPDRCIAIFRRSTEQAKMLAAAVCTGKTVPQSLQRLGPQCQGIAARAFGRLQWSPSVSCRSLVASRGPHRDQNFAKRGVSIGITHRRRGNWGLLWARCSEFELLMREIAGENGHLEQHRQASWRRQWNKARRTGVASIDRWAKPLELTRPLRTMTCGLPHAAHAVNACAGPLVGKVGLGCWTTAAATVTEDQQQGSCQWLVR